METDAHGGYFVRPRRVRSRSALILARPGTVATRLDPTAFCRIRRESRIGPDFALAENVEKARTVVRRYHPQSSWMGLWWVTVGLLLALAMISGCRRDATLVESHPVPSGSDGIINGTVRGPEKAAAIEGRAVEVINIETSERQRVSTNNAGSFTLKVRPGKYRVELALRSGEAFVKQPGVLDVNPSAVDAHADFVIGTVRASRPRGPGYRVDHGLGAPVV